MGRVCEHCGSDTYRSDNFDRVITRSHRLESENRKLAAANGIHAAHARMRGLEHDDRIAGFQRKVQQQARVIRRLEKKIRDLGSAPHEGVTPSETSPVTQE